MSYQISGLIEAKDFNNLAWGTDNGGTYTASPKTFPTGGSVYNLAMVHGEGRGRQGLGQSTAGYTPAAIGSVVTAAQWTSLLNSLESVRIHQNNASISPDSVVAGDKITYYSSVLTNINNAWNASLTGTSHLLGVTPLTWTGSGTNYLNGTVGWGASGSRTGRFTSTLTWTNGNQARYWWNAGGRISLSLDFDPGVGGAISLPNGISPRHNSWSDLVDACGTITLRYNNTTKAGGSGSTSILLDSNNGGYWLNTAINTNHPGTTTTVFKQFSSASPYTTNFVKVDLAYSGATLNGGYPVLTIYVDLVNTRSSGGFQDTVFGKPIYTMNVYPPDTSALTTAPGNPSISVSWNNL